MQSPQTPAPPIELRREPTYYYHGLDVAGGDGVWQFADRIAGIHEHVDLRPQDTVLDVGCAEGLISMEVARKVKRVDAYELSPQRVEAAKQIAAQRGLTNITFAQADAASLPVERMSYDVVMFLGVYHHVERSDRMAALMKLMDGAKRMFVMRTPLVQTKSPNRLSNIYAVVEHLNFTATIYPNRDAPGGNLMVMSRE